VRQKERIRRLGIGNLHDIGMKIRGGYFISDVGRLYLGLVFVETDILITKFQHVALGGGELEWDKSDVFDRALVCG